MKTRTSNLRGTIAGFVALCVCLTQSIPMGWAIDHGDLFQPVSNGQSVPEISVEDKMNNVVESSSDKTVSFHDAFFGESPLAESKVEASDQVLPLSENESDQLAIAELPGLTPKHSTSKEFSDLEEAQKKVTAAFNEVFETEYPCTDLFPVGSTSLPDSMCGALFAYEKTENGVKVYLPESIIDSINEDEANGQLGSNGPEQLIPEAPVAEVFNPEISEKEARYLAVERLKRELNVEEIALTDLENFTLEDNVARFTYKDRAYRADYQYFQHILEVDSETGIASERAGYQIIRWLSQDALVAKYHEEMKAVDEIMSGIAREGVTMAEVDEARMVLDEVRKVLETLLELGIELPQDLLDVFNNRLDDLDKMMRKEPMVVILDDGTKVELDVTQAMRVINEEYRRLVGNEGIDYDRLPGISEEDVKDLETLLDYLNYRQVGAETTISVFKALSPVGSYKLLERVIKKFGKDIIGGDFDVDGIKEVNLSELRRHVNGTAKAYHDGVKLIRELFEEHNIKFPNEGTISFNDILETAKKITTLNKDLTSSIEALIKSYEMEAPFESLVRNELTRLINDRYNPLVKSFGDHLKNNVTEVQKAVYQHNIELPSGNPVSYAALSDAVQAMNDLHADLTDRVVSLMEEMDDQNLESRLVSNIRQALVCKANGCWDGPYNSRRYIQGAYETLIKSLNSIIQHSGVSYEIEGHGTVTMTQNDWKILMVDGLTNKVDDLLQFPGIREKITREQMNELEMTMTESLRGSIPFSRIAARPSLEAISMFGRRGLAGLILNAFADDVIVDGKLDHDKFRRAILMDSHLEILFNAAQGVIKGSVMKVDMIVGDLDKGMTLDTYEKLYDLLKDTHAAVESILKLALDGVIYDARRLVMSMLQDDYNVLVNSIKGYTTQGVLQVNINGQSHVVNARMVRTLMRNLMTRLAVKLPNTPDYNKYQYIRLNGVDAEHVENLMTQGELDRYTALRFVSYDQKFNRGMNANFATEEFMFRTILSVLEEFGAAILDDNGNVNYELIEAKLLSSVEVNVPEGTTLLNHFKTIVNDRVEEALISLNEMNFRDWDERMRAYEVVIGAIKDIELSSKDLISDLTNDEINILRGLANYGWHNDGTKKISEVWNLYYNKLREKNVEIRMPDGKVVKVNLYEITRIPHFPRNKNYDRELFVGIDPEDFEGAEHDPRVNVELPKDPDARVWPTSSTIDMEKLAVNIIKRIYAQINEIPEIYRDRMFSNGLVNVEMFRRYIKGVDALHKRIVEKVQGWTAEEIEKIQALKTKPMTRESIEKIYAELMAYRAELTDYLKHLTDRHEVKDVVEMEEDATNIFQNAFGEIIDYMRNNVLTYVYTIGDKGPSINVEIPVHEITERLMKILEEKFPGEDIGAHHFASFFGISINDLRAYNKLEEFLSVQVIALPKTGHVFVEILSKLSEIGFAQMITDAIGRHSDVAIVGGKVDVDALIKALSDGSEAVRKAIQSISDVAENASDALSALDQPLTSETFKKAISIYQQAKLSIVNVGNAAVNGFTEEMFDKVNAAAKDYYDDLKALLNRVVTLNPITLTAKDGTVFKLDLTEVEPAVKEALLEKFPPVLHANGKTIAPEDVLLDENEEPILDRDGNLINKNHVARDEEGNIMLDDEGYPVVLLMAQERKISLQPMMIQPDRVVSHGGAYKYPVIWQPFPTYFNPEDRLTLFGMFDLIVRLAEKYGSFTVDEDGAFSIEKFLNEMFNNSDLDRAALRFEQIEEDTINKIKNLVPGGDEPIVLSTIEDLNDLLNDARKKMMDILTPLLGDYSNRQPAINLGNKAWANVMNTYEGLVFPKEVLVVSGLMSVKFNAKELMDILVEEYGKTVLREKRLVAVLHLTRDGQVIKEETPEEDSEAKLQRTREFIDAYLNGPSESVHSYSAFRTLYQNYWWYGGGIIRGIEIQPEGGELNLGPYSANLGQLNSLPGISSADLGGLDVAAKDTVELTLRVDARTLLKGLLDLNAIAPGSGVQTVGKTSGNTASASMEVAASSRMSSIRMADSYYLQYLNRVENFSKRDIYYRVLANMIRDHAHAVTDGKGSVDAEKFRKLLQNPPPAKKFVPVSQMDKDEVALINKMIGNAFELKGVDLIPVDENFVEYRYHFVAKRGGEDHLHMTRFTGEVIVKRDDNGELHEIFKIENYGASLNVNPEINYIKAPRPVELTVGDKVENVKDIALGQVVILGGIVKAAPGKILFENNTWRFAPFKTDEERFRLEIANHHNEKGSLKLRDVIIHDFKLSPKQELSICPRFGFCGSILRYDVTYEVAGEKFTAEAVVDHKDENKGKHYRLESVEEAINELELLDAIGVEKWIPDLDSIKVEKVNKNKEGKLETVEITYEDRAYVIYITILPPWVISPRDGEGKANSVLGDYNHDGQINEDDRTYRQELLDKSGIENQIAALDDIFVRYVELNDKGIAKSLHAIHKGRRFVIPVEKVDATQLPWWKEQHMKAVLDILKVTEDDIEGIYYIGDAPGTLRAICDGPGCAWPEKIEVVLKDGRTFNGTASYSWDHVWTVSLYDEDGNHMGTRKGGGPIVETLYPDATEQPWWKDEHMKAVLDILNVTKDDIEVINYIGDPPGTLRAICNGPGCAWPEKIEVVLKDGRRFDGTASYSWDHVWTVSLYDKDGNHMGTRKGGGEFVVETLYPDATEQPWWKDEHMKAVLDILNVTKDDIEVINYIGDPPGTLRAICNGPGCAWPEKIEVVLKDGRRFDGTASYSWDHVWTVSLYDKDGNHMGTRKGGGEFVVETLYPDATEQPWWKDEHFKAILEILEVSEEDIDAIQYIGDPPGTLRIICMGPGCAWPEKIRVVLKDGRVFDGTASYSWDGIWSVTLHDENGDLVGSRRGGGMIELPIKRLASISGFTANQGSGVKGKFSGQLVGFDPKHHKVLLWASNEPVMLPLRTNNLDVTEMISEDGSFTFEKHLGIGTYDVKLMVVSIADVEDGTIDEGDIISEKLIKEVRIAGNDPYPTPDKEAQATAVKFQRADRHNLAETSMSLNDGAEETESRDIEIKIEKLPSEVASISWAVNKRNKTAFSDRVNVADIMDGDVLKKKIRLSAFTKMKNFVNVRLHDANGKVIKWLWKAIKYVVKNKPSLKINNGANTTDDRQVTLNLSNLPADVTKVSWAVNSKKAAAFKNEFTVDGETHEEKITLPGGFGKKYVTVKLHRADGSVVKWCWDAITLVKKEGVAAPQPISFEINDGKNETDEDEIELKLSNLPAYAARVRWAVNKKNAKDFSVGAEVSNGRLDAKIKLPRYYGQNFVNIRVEDENGGLIKWLWKGVKLMKRDAISAESMNAWGHTLSSFSSTSKKKKKGEEDEK